MRLDTRWGHAVLELDHIAVAAATLDEGRKAVETALGVALQPGGQHEHYGTHNLLLGMEDGLYLEVIAIDPGVPKPAYPRWFDLDRFNGRAKPHIWICRTDDLAGMAVRCPQAGPPVSLERGDLRWQMAVPESGILPYDNAFPALIEWQCTGHPAARLAPSGCRLARLVVAHPEARALEAELRPVLDDNRIVFESGPPALCAEIDTPFGLKVLE